MRLIQTLVPDGKRETVIEILTEEEIDFALTEETSGSGYSDVLYVPAHADDVELIVDRLREVGVERDGYMVVSDVEAIVSEQFEEQQDEKEAADPDGGDAERISRDELRTKAAGLSRSTPNFLALTVISAIVATAGLLQNSAAVVVGSMVIAPLIGPAMASCVGTVINDDDLFWDGIRSQVIGLGVAVLSATLFAIAYRFTLAPGLDLLLIQQVAERAHPGLLALAIALGAGTAGALALTSGADATLVGVMIAVALIPPSASVGLGIAYADLTLAVGAGVLVSVNLLSINVAGIVTIWIKRYEPTHWYDARQARRGTIKRLVVFALVVLLLTSFLTASSLDARETMLFETEVESVAAETTENLLGVDFQYRADLISQQPTGVTIYVYGDTPPRAEAIQTAIREQTGVNIEVTVVTQRVDTA